MVSAERNPATAHLFIINPLSGERMDNLFSTHPNTENRIAALRHLAGQTTGGSDATPYGDAPIDDASPGPWSHRHRQVPPRRGGPWG